MKEKDTHGLTSNSRQRLTDGQGPGIHPSDVFVVRVSEWWVPWRLSSTSINSFVFQIQIINKEKTKVDEVEKKTNKDLLALPPCLLKISLWDDMEVPEDIVSDCGPLPHYLSSIFPSHAHTGVCERKDKMSGEERDEDRYQPWIKQFWELVSTVGSLLSPIFSLSPIFHIFYLIIRKCVRKRKTK